MKFIVFFLFIATLSADFASDMLDSHNNFRQGILNGSETRQPQAKTMPMMQWDTNLAAKAQEWATNCIYGHSSEEFRIIPGFKYVGENIAAGTDYSDGKKATFAWYSEIQYYNYDDNSCNKTCGHYTQVVWADSTKLGCGTAKCSGLFNGRGGDFIVCMYGEGGNMDGEKPYVSVNSSEELEDEYVPVPTNTPLGVVVDNTNRMVELHNEYRRAILNGTETRLPKAKSMPMMMRDEILVKSAKKVVDKCLFSIQKKDLVDTRFSISGSSFYYEPTSDEEIVANWYSDIRYYNYETNKCSVFCKYFYNIVSDKTTKLGCARNNCDGWEYIVCLYGPAPNMKNRPYTKA